MSSLAVRKSPPSYSQRGTALSPSSRAETAEKNAGMDLSPRSWSFSLSSLKPWRPLRGLNVGIRKIVNLMSQHRGVFTMGAMLVAVGSLPAVHSASQASSVSLGGSGDLAHHFDYDSPSYNGPRPSSTGPGPSSSTGPEPSSTGQPSSSFSSGPMYSTGSPFRMEDYGYYEKNYLQTPKSEVPNFSGFAVALSLSTVVVALGASCLGIKITRDEDGAIEIEVGGELAEDLEQLHQAIEPQRQDLLQPMQAEDQQLQQGFLLMLQANQRILQANQRQWQFRDFLRGNNPHLRNAIAFNKDKFTSG